MIDLNSSIGSWPFGPLPSDINSLTKTLHQAGITHSHVGSLEGLLYLDVQQANLHCYETIKSSGDFFSMFAVINPNFPGWQDDLDECCQCFADHLSGIRLFPNYHNYNLNDDCLLSLLKSISKIDSPLPIQIVSQMVDLRTQHPTCRTSKVDLKFLPQLLKTFPKINFAVLNSANPFSEIDIDAIGNKANLFLDFAFLDRLDGINQLIDFVGIDQILLATNSPVTPPLSAVYKLQESGLSDQQIQQITVLNAQRFLGGKETK